MQRSDVLYIPVTGRGCNPQLSEPSFTDNNSLENGLSALINQESVDLYSIIDKQSITFKQHNCFYVQNHQFKGVFCHFYDLSSAVFVINNLLPFSSPHQEKIAAFCFPPT